MDPDDDHAFRPESSVSFGPFHLFVAGRRLEKDGRPVAVGVRALDLLIALLERPGEVLTRQELIARVWAGLSIAESNLHAQIATLRRLLGEGRGGARYIETVVGRGYCFVAPVVPSVRQVPSARQVPAPQSVVTDLTQGATLPALLTRVVGRDETIRFVSNQLMTWRFVSVVGPGGMGKTTVAVSVAHALLNRFGGAVFFVDLAALTDPQLVPSAVASVLGFMLQSPDPVRSLLAFIGDRRLLLVLDNCEHVIGSAASLAESVVNAAPQVHILATSREALRVQGEHVHRLHALACPPQDAGLTAAEALKYPAAELFMERATASGYGSALGDIDAPVVSRICNQLDGIVLAIELAASRAGIHGIRGIAELLESSFAWRWNGRRTAVPRHRTLDAMLDWSFNLLSQREQLVLCRFSVFIGDFTLEAAGEIASDGAGDEPYILDSVSGLIAKSLIFARDIKGLSFCRLLDMTRGYAAARLVERGEADRIARRHATFYCKFLQRDDIARSTFGEHDLSSYAPHVGNVRAALEWALANRGDVLLGVEIAAGAAPLFLCLSLLDECRRWCELALAAFDDSARGTRLEMILQEALGLSSMYTRGSSTELRDTLERALAIAEALDDRARQLHILSGIAMLLLRLGDVRGALATARKSHAVAQDTGSRAGLVVSQWIVGACHHFLGDQAAAQQSCEDGLAHATEYGIVNANFFGFYHRAGGLVALARALWLRGFADQALRIARRVIDEEAARDHPVSVGFSLAYGLSVFLWAGDFATTDAFIERLIAHAGRYSMLPYRALGIAQRGELALGRDQPEAGVELLQTALEALRGVRHQPLLSFFTGLLADGLRRSGRPAQALDAIDSAMALARDSAVDFGLAELLRVKARVIGDLAGQHSPQAMDCLAEAIAVAQRQSALAWELRATIDLAGLLAERGERDRARRELAAVYRRFNEGFDTRDLLRARRLIEELA